MTAFPDVDPVTLAVIQNGLQQVCNEMDLAFVRAAFSPVISEALDRSDGIYARGDGRLIAQGERVGLLKVRLYRPFDTAGFLDALPDVRFRGHNRRALSARRGPFSNLSCG